MTAPISVSQRQNIVTNVCVCVCVHHINRSGLNLMTNNPPREQKCGCRSGPWSAGQEGKKETKKPQKYPIQWKKTKQSRNKAKKASETEETRIQQFYVPHVLHNVQ